MRIRKALISKITLCACALLLALSLCGCGKESNGENNTPSPEAGEADSAGLQGEKDGKDADPELTVTPTDKDNTGVIVSDLGDLSDEQALMAIRNYCCVCNRDLEEIISRDEYPVYWEVSSSDEKQVVILFRSYTSAQIRYYTDRVTGETYVTEFMPGISTEETLTEESFNAKDYTSVALLMTGLWQTGSIICEEDGPAHPAAYVKFKSSEIEYGQILRNEFVPAYVDKISRFEESGDGSMLIQAESSQGIKYTYKSSEGSINTLEYYETWDQKDFADTYSGGGSLNRCDMSSLTGDAADDAYGTLYMEALEDNFSDDASRYEYKLIYINDDDIPELYFSGDCEASGSGVIYIGRDGTPGIAWMARIGGAYEPRENFYYHSQGHMGYYYDEFYSFKDGDFVMTEGGYYTDEYDPEALDEDGVPGTYRVDEVFYNDKPVTYDEYCRRVKEMLAGHELVDLQKLTYTKDGVEISAEEYSEHFGEEGYSFDNGLLSYDELIRELKNAG